MLSNKYLSLLLGSVMLVSCGGGGSSGNSSNLNNDPGNTTDPDPVVMPFSGTRPSVEQLYSAPLLEALENIGIQINLGEDPPNVEGSYLFNPVILQATSVPGDQSRVGQGFADPTVTFSNQDNTSLTLDLEARSTNTSVVGTGSFISGSGDSFTVYFLTEVTQSGHTFESTETYSGVVTDAGIENLQRAVFVVDDRGDPNNNIIPNNTGRLFIDQDGLSMRVTAKILSGSSVAGVTTTGQSSYSLQ